MPNNVLVTGAAGFIGYHLSHALLKEGREVVGLDNLNEYYDVRLKKERLALLQKYPNFRFAKLDIADASAMHAFFKKENFDLVLHMAAQAGVRYSMTHPHAYVQSNLVGFMNILEACRMLRVQHLVLASTSSVYGLNTKMPFSEHDIASHPISFYAATKRAGELMAHTYAHLYHLPCTVLRLFTVYGPWGRPDMAFFLFTKAILEGKPIDVFNHGNMERDFTYIDDAVEGILKVSLKAPQGSPKWNGKSPDPATSSAPFRIYNIGNSQPVNLLNCIEVLESCLGKKAKKNFKGMQPGDLPATFADTSDLSQDFGYRLQTPLQKGIEQFVDWYRKYYTYKI